MSTSSPRRPQLTFDELQQLKWLLGALLSLIGVSTVFYMDVDAFTLMGLTIIATVATLVRPTLPSRTPAIAHTLAFPLIVAFFAADLWLKTEVLPAMVRLDILLLLYRNISYRQRRDDLQIIVLGLFLVIVAGVLTVSLTFAAQILIYTGCALALLLVITLSDAATGATPRPPLAPGEIPAWAQHADWLRLFRRMREVTDWRVVGLGAILFAGVVVVSAVLFLAIPRFQLENSMFLDRFISKKAKSGFSETIRLGDVSEIQQDNSVALSVDVSDQTQIPSTPYWRMLVLNQYDNGVFRISSQLNGQEFERERTGSTARGYATPRRGPAVYWTFYLESGVSRFLPLLGPFSVVTFREAQNFKLAPRLALVALRDDPVTMTAYRIEGFDQSSVLPDPRYADKWRAKSPDERRGDIQVRISPGERDRATLRGVVAEITNGETLAAPVFAERVGAWLKKNHGYSLSPVIPGNIGDPVVRWLSSREAGHCELFAGSFVLLARTAGFPARVVTGFRGGSWNGYSNNFTIRNADAHAWAEIFDERAGGWTRVDPLAPTAAAQTDIRGEAAIVSRLDRSWKARLDSLRVFWYRRIVSFDQRSQAETLKAVRDATQNSGKRVREFLEAMNLSIHAWFARPWDFFRALKTGITVVLLLGMGWWMYAHGGRVWRELTMRRGPHGADPVRMEAGRWLRQLAEFGARTPADESVVGELQRLRFGARDSWTRPEKIFRRARQTARERRRSRRASSP